MCEAFIALERKNQSVAKYVNYSRQYARIIPFMKLILKKICGALVDVLYISLNKYEHYIVQYDDSVIDLIR